METMLVLNSSLLWAMLLLNLLLTLGLARRVHAAFPEMETLKVGQRAPDFIAQNMEGRTVQMKDYAGQAVAFVFISPHCQPCRDKLPIFPAIRAKASEQGVEFVLVSDADANETRSFLKELDGKLSVLIAQPQTARFITDYKIHATPSYCIVDANGKVHAAEIGLDGLEKKMMEIAGRR